MRTLQEHSSRASSSVIHRGQGPRSLVGQFVPAAVWRKVSDQTKALIDRLLLERLSLAGIARSVGVSEEWLQRYVSGKFCLAPAPTPTAEGEKGLVMLRCDELWSFVGSKSRKAWVWLAM